LLNAVFFETVTDSGHLFSSYLRDYGK